MNGANDSQDSILVRFYDDSLQADEAVIFKGWKIRKNSKLYVGSPIFSYVTSVEQPCQSGNQTDSICVSTKIFKSDCAGIVIEVTPFNVNDAVKIGDVAATLQRCQHPCIMKDMCADCGENLRVKDGMPGERVITTPARVSMIHSIPELQVTIDEAYKLGAADEENVLKHRKLVLLVDLDQTLVHTTNEDVELNLKDVHHFQLYGSNSPWYHVRLRPNTIHFLKTMCDSYEMHICTFGSRMYAHKIAEILDPDGSIFGKRILSRDECFNPMLKTANLKALFPCGDRLVCIIDDREDVWDFAANVIRVKPYRFFLYTGDISAPPGFAKPDPNIEEDETKAKIEDAFNEYTTSSMTEHVKFEDDDDYLYYLEEILRKVHTAFYQLYDRMPENERPPDIHSVIPYVKSKVLKKVNLVFSGVVPINENLHDSAMCKLAKSLGATVQESIIPLHTVAKPTLLAGGKKFMKYDSCNDNRLRATTHLVASKPGTLKFRQTEKLGGQVKVVNPDWLASCAERWEKVDERLFPLSTPKWLKHGHMKIADRDNVPQDLCVISSNECATLEKSKDSANNKRKHEVDEESDQESVTVEVDQMPQETASVMKPSHKDSDSLEELEHTASSENSDGGDDEDEDKDEDEDDEMAAALDKEFY